MMVFRSATLLSLVALCGCASPRSVRDLAVATAPFVVATHASVPAVERAYAAQTTRTRDELGFWEARRLTARREIDSHELLWKFRDTTPDKRSVKVMERVRAGDELLRNPVAPAPAAELRSRADAGIGKITKLTQLLNSISSNRGVDLPAAMAFGKKTWDELKALEADAEADADAGSEVGAAGGQTPQ